MLSLGAFGLAWAVFRAIVQAVTIDEAETYELFAGRSFAHCWDPSSNNHLLNSVLIRLSTSVLGLSELTLRLPALTGAAIYIAAAFALCSMLVEAGILRILLFAALIYNPFVFDYFVAARGYGLANAFLLCALACVVWAHRSDPRRFLAMHVVASLCLGLAFCSHLAFALVCASLGAAILAWGCTRPFIRTLRMRLLLLAAVALPGFVLAALPTWRIVLRFPKGEILDGATSIAGTIRSVFEASLNGPNPSLFGGRWVAAFTGIGWFLAIALAVLVLYIGALSFVRKKQTQIATLLAATVALTLAGHWFCFRFLHWLFPRTRAAIFLAPLLTLFAGAVLAGGSRGQAAARRIAISLLGGLVVYFFLCMRLTYFCEWQYLADVKTVYSRLASLNHESGVQDIGVHWRYAGSLNFYRRLSGKETFREFDGFESPPYPADKLVYVLYWPSGERFIRSQGLWIAYRSRATGVVIGVRPPFNAHDDLDPEIAYSGDWIRDSQFEQAANETLTYSSSTGSVARFRFEGTGVTWVYTRTFNRGLAEVVIDGSSRGVLDLYAPVTEWRARTSFGGLQPGMHELEIRVLGRQNPKAKGRFVDVDLLIVK
jgi:hypothetical protein